MFGSLILAAALLGQTCPGGGGASGYLFYVNEDVTATHSGHPAMLQVAYHNPDCTSGTATIYGIRDYTNGNFYYDVRSFVNPVQRYANAAYKVSVCDVPGGGWDGWFAAINTGWLQLTTPIEWEVLPVVTREPAPPAVPAPPCPILHPCCPPTDPMPNGPGGPVVPA